MGGVTEKIYCCDRGDNDNAPSLLAELNPMYKEKQETEQRFGKIEGSIGEMKELMKKQQEMVENFIKKFES